MVAAVTSSSGEVVACPVNRAAASFVAGFELVKLIETVRLSR